MLSEGATANTLRWEGLWMLTAPNMAGKSSLMRSMRIFLRPTPACRDIYDKEEGQRSATIRRRVKELPESRTCVHERVRGRVRGM